MKRISAFVAITLAAAAMPALAQVGVSVNVGQPGFYGQINIGDFPQPRLVYERPVVVYSHVIDEQPLYLHVPPGHEKHWNKHCARYNACGRRVYFVRDDWYNNEYVPHYRHEHGDHGDGDHGGGDHGDQGDHGDRGGHGEGGHHGKGHGHGKHGD